MTPCQCEQCIAMQDFMTDFLHNLHNQIEAAFGDTPVVEPIDEVKELKRLYELKAPE